MKTNQTPKDSWLTPAQMAKQSGVSIDTLRYYEREGLLSSIQRSPSGHRRYSRHDASWIGILRCLRETGMSISQLRHYCDLSQTGVTTQAQRIVLLQAHKNQVEEQLSELQDALELINHKIHHYQNELKQTGAPHEF